MVAPPIRQASSSSPIRRRHQATLPHTRCAILQILRPRLDDLSGSIGRQEREEGASTTYRARRSISIVPILLSHSWSSRCRRSRECRKQRLELSTCWLLCSRCIATWERTRHDAYWTRTIHLDVESWTCKRRLFASEEHGHHTTRQPRFQTTHTVRAVVR
jgi:hypothetical protein